MKKIICIICTACALILAGSCSKTILEVSPAELSWEWNETKTQIVTVTANYEWTARVSDESNWTITPTNDGKTFTVAPKTENRASAALTATITITSKELFKTITCTQNGGDFIDGYEYVDLGLSVKWATCKIGAKSETDYGSYFAWGETAEKADYTWDTYKWGKYANSDKTDEGMTKYNTKDGLTTLEAGDDPATVNWGSKWRTPTINECKELLDKTKCVWTWITKKDADGNDVNGYTVTSKINGNSIFLPAAGYRDGT